MQTTMVERSQSHLLPNPAGVMRADSVEEAVMLVGSSLSPHRLQIRAGVPRAMASLSALQLGDCALASLQYGFDVDIDAGYISDYFMVKMTIAGEGRIASDDRLAGSSSRSIFVTSPQAHTRFHMSSSCRHLTTRLSRRVVEERLMQILGRRLHVPLEFDLQIPSDSDFGRAWSQLVWHICEISATAPTVLACESVRNQYSRMLIELLLHAAPHSYSELLQQADAPLSPRHVRRAEEYIAGHLEQIRSTADIAAAIGVSLRTLQNGFKRVFNMSPAEYVRQARIRALHRALQNADATQSVTTLMMAVGISSFGRYAEYYRELIGEPPSATLRQAL